MPIFQIIGTKEKFHKVSGVFFMVMKKRLMLFADCSVIVSPDAHDLADIAIDTAETAKKFGIEPRIAFLSFSTHGSSKDGSLARIREAAAIAQDRRPDLIMEGEIQVDAAIVPEVAKRKFPDSPLAGEANILIFPDLNSANIGYKLCERLAKASAIGPILQGLRKPVNDLSRGCSWMDIVHTAAITACETIP
jgi:phosphate acetyltransferase